MSEIEELRAENEHLRKRCKSLWADLGQANTWSWELHDRAEAAEGTLSRLRALVLRDHTPEEHLHEDMGGQDTFRYCAGCGADLDEQECEYLAVLADS